MDIKYIPATAIAERLWGRWHNDIFPDDNVTIGLSHFGNPQIRIARGKYEACLEVHPEAYLNPNFMSDADKAISRKLEQLVNES